MNRTPTDSDEHNSGPKTFWEFLDRWLRTVGHGGENLAPVFRFALIGAAAVYLSLVVWRVWLISHALTTFFRETFDASVLAEIQVNGLQRAHAEKLQALIERDLDNNFRNFASLQIDLASEAMQALATPSRLR